MDQCLKLDVLLFTALHLHILIKLHIENINLHLLLLIKKNNPLCSYQTVSSQMEYQAKLNENYMPFLFCISSFEVTSQKKLHDKAWFQVHFKEMVRSQGKELRDCLSGETPLGLQFIFYQIKCSLGLIYKLHFWKCCYSWH